MNPYVERDQIVGGQMVEDLRQLEDEDVLLGTVMIFGIHAYARFVRVEDKGLGQQPTRDPHGRWMALVEAEPEGVFRTVEVPGFEGEWAFFVSPFME